MGDRSRGKPSSSSATVDLLSFLEGLERRGGRVSLPHELLRRLRRELADCRETEQRQAELLRHAAAERARMEQLLGHLAPGREPAATAAGAAERRRAAVFAEALIDALDPHIAVLDAGGKIIFVNEAWRAFARENAFPDPRAGFGASYLEVCDRARGPGEDEARAAAGGIRSVARGELATFELEYSCHGLNEQRWFVLRVSRFSEGEKSRLVIAHENVTGPRWDEEQHRLAKDSAEAESRARDRFLAILGHELRTPLTPVLLRTMIMQREPGLPLQIMEGLELIRRNAELEARLIDDVLDVARIMQGKLQIRLETADAHERMRAALEIYQRDIEHKGLQLEIYLRAPAHFVSADPARLQQVFWNLIGNAVKYTPRGGEIFLRSRNELPRTLRLEVADTGAGIEPEQLPRIFLPFERGAEQAQAPPRRQGGLGLGLSIAKALVEEMGGRLTAASAGRGRGSVFAVELPTVAAARLRPAPRRKRQGARTARALCILLVEDNEDTLGLLSRQLSSAGHEVTTAATVQAALEAAAGRRFDLLVVDIGLPDGTGWDLLSILRRRGPVRAIALSGFAGAGDIQKSAEAGFLEHVTKPISPDQLERAIQRAIS